MSIAAKVGTFPVGTLLDYVAGAATPTGWAKCDGSVLSQASYPTLFSLIGHRPQIVASTAPNISSFVGGAGAFAVNSLYESNGRLIARRSTNTGLPDEWAWSSDGGATWTTFGVTGAVAGTVNQSNMSWNGTRFVFARSDITASTTVTLYHSTDGNTWTAGGGFNFASNGTPNIVSMAGLGHIVTHNASTAVAGTAADPPAAIAALATSLPGTPSVAGMGRGYACAISGVGFLLCDSLGNIRFYSNGGAAGSTPTGIPAASTGVRVWSFGTAFLATSITGLVSTSTTGAAFTDRSTACRAAGLVHATAVPVAVYDGTSVFVGDSNALVKATLADLSTWSNVVSMSSVFTTGVGSVARQNLVKFGVGSLAESQTLSVPAFPNMQLIAASPTTGRLVLLGTNTTIETAIWVSYDGGATWGRTNVLDFGQAVSASLLAGTYSNDAFLTYDTTFGLRRLTMPYTQASQFQLPLLRSMQQGVTKIIKAV